MKANPLLCVGPLTVSVLIGLTGCAWLKPPTEGGRGAVGPRESERWEYTFPSWGQESREHLPSRDFNRWANQQLRQLDQAPPPRRGR